MKEKYTTTSSDQRPDSTKTAGRKVSALANMIMGLSDKEIQALKSKRVGMVKTFFNKPGLKWQAIKAITAILVFRKAREKEREELNDLLQEYQRNCDKK